ncbi:hypothetical protein LTR86_005349 [Recurvomyces mirabilis]|nr:hypothetical protein LTR86_005349 [Recurvomyces mirabilis]
MQSPIASRTKKILQLFEHVGQSSPAAAYQQTRFAVVDLEDSIAQFRLWAANLGAYHPVSDQRSVDSRLFNVPALRENVTEQLDDLLEVLRDIDDIRQGVREDGSLADAESVDNRAHLEDEEADTDDAADNQVNGSGSQTELQELVATIPDLISGLLRTSILIRKGTMRDRYVKAAAARYDPFMLDLDIMHVREKFAKIGKASWLYKRLGNAITQRRQYLRYQRDHGNRIASIDEHATRSGAPLVIAVEHAGTPMSAAQTLVPPLTLRTRPTLTPTKASTTIEVSTVDINAFGADLDQEYDDDRSQATSFASEADVPEVAQSLRVCDLHDVAKGKTQFECPYCRGIVQSTKQKSWRKHVYRDLRAYVCTFEACDVGLFEDIDAWFDHEMSTHRRQWICISCPDRVFPTPDRLQEHLRRQHNETDRESVATTKAALDASSRPVSEIAASSCPLCDELDKVSREQASRIAAPIPEQNAVMLLLSRFKRHLGRHQEELALFAIPPANTSLESGGSQDTAGGQQEAVSDFAAEQELESESAENILSSPQKPGSLYEACQRGDEDFVREQLHMGADVHSDAHLGTPLQAAAKCGNEVIVRLLLDHGADVNAQGGEHVRSLYTAAAEGHDEIVRLLLEHGAEVDSQGPENGNALYAAVYGGHKGVVRLLLAHGANPNFGDGDYGSPINLATYFNHVDIVSTLLDSGANVNNADGIYDSALTTAAMNGHEDIVLLLLRYGMNFRPDPRGDVNTPVDALVSAIKFGSLSIVQLLIEHGMNVNALDGLHRSPLYYAAEGGSESILQALLDAGANPAAERHESSTPLQVASFRGHESVVKLLLQAGADGSGPEDSETDGPLVAAAQEGHESIVKLLLERREESVGSRRRKPYQLAFEAAVAGGHTSVAQLLDKHANGADGAGRHRREDQAPSAQSRKVASDLLSIGDLLMLSQTAWKCGRAMSSAGKNSPAEFAEVHSACDALSEALKLAAEALHQQDESDDQLDGAIRPQMDPVFRSAEVTLREFESFIERYQMVKKRQTTGGSIVERTWSDLVLANYRTIRWTTQGGSIRELSQKLQIHTQSITIATNVWVSRSLLSVEETIAKLQDSSPGSRLDDPGNSEITSEISPSKIIPAIEDDVDPDPADAKAETNRQDEIVVLKGKPSSSRPWNSAVQAIRNLGSKRRE